MTLPLFSSLTKTADPQAVESTIDGWRKTHSLTTKIVPIDELSTWTTDEETGDIRHESGTFFRITGLSCHTAEASWHQPIIDQPDVGLLGLAVRRQNDVMQCLMQAKSEPGTVGGTQLAPTVQATTSNYSRRHGGRKVPYISLFLESTTHPRYGVAQSEQGSRFFKKKNRNIVTVVDNDFPACEGYAWFSLGELNHALRSGDLVNFDARSALSLLYATESTRESPEETERRGTGFSHQILASLWRTDSARHHTDSLLAELLKARFFVPASTPIALDEVDGWHRTARSITHTSGAFFAVVGAEVVATHREVTRWDQPIIVEQATAVLGLAVTLIDGVMHALLRLTSEPGLPSGLEFGATFHYVPQTRELVSSLPPPPFADLFIGDSGTTLFDTVLSAEGGRFFEARQRHIITLIDVEDEPPGYAWVALHQYAQLIKRGLLVNEQARSLFTCLISLVTPSPSYAR